MFWQPEAVPWQIACFVRSCQLTGAPKSLDAWSRASRAPRATSGTILTLAFLCTAGSEWRQRSLCCDRYWRLAIFQWMVFKPGLTLVHGLLVSTEHEGLAKARYFALVSTAVGMHAVLDTYSCLLPHLKGLQVRDDDPQASSIEATSLVASLHFVNGLRIDW
eukprot:scaffold104537_cov36-Prasinocladus_malaysianus.AAC.1